MKIFFLSFFDDEHFWQNLKIVNVKCSVPYFVIIEVVYSESNYSILSALLLFDKEFHRVSKTRKEKQLEKWSKSIFEKLFSRFYLSYFIVIGVLFQNHMENWFKIA